MPPEPSQVADALAFLERAVAEKTLSNRSAENIRRWLTRPGYAGFLPELVSLIQTGNCPELERCFWEVLPFGTGGRRGPMAPLGSATMNDRTVAESACGLADYLAGGSHTTASPAPSVAIAFDTRNRSRHFARIAACVLAARGFDVRLFDAPRATPELSFAVRHLKCAAGLMISASHNPPADNGVKVYWSTGGQVLPPHDRGIMEAVLRVDEIPMLEFDRAIAEGRIQPVGGDVDDAYVAAICRQSLSPERSVSILYTPLHGVGESSVYRILKASGFDDVEIYGPHRELSGDFPNVPKNLANPELPSVFEGPLVRARETGADLVLASDPDADRLGAAIRSATGDFVYLSGNRIGAILADHVLRRREALGRLNANQYLLTTLVTTPLIARIAAARGVRCADDLLVGFKYIAAAMDRMGPKEFLFACEESLGFLAGDDLRDKDAAIGALLLSECAAGLKQEGRTLHDRLDEIHLQHGYVAEMQHSLTRRGAEGQAEIARLMARTRESPPRSLGGLALTRVQDYGRHEVRSLPDNVKVADMPEPQSDLVIFEAELSDGLLTFALRPSGTEPKVKFYLFLRRTVGGDGLPACRATSDAQAKTVLDDFLTWAS